jgi:hypothetical protein
MNEKTFPKGLIVKPPHAKAPDFIKCGISIKREEFIAWLEDQDGDWINLDVKESKQGKWYAQTNDWKPDRSKEKPSDDPKPLKGGDDFVDDQEIPF